MIHNLYKQRGETPLECIRKFVEKNPNFKENKMTYMGRLDPLAEGVLLMASGDDVKKREEFLGLDKVYDFGALFGFATDTYDVLGKIVKTERLENLWEDEVRKVAMVYEGEREQEYPLYSSKRIASQGIVPAKKKIIIYKILFHNLEIINNKELFGRLLMDISKVKGNFRQNEILTLWKETLFKNPITKIFLGKFSAHVSAGTYIRSLVNDMGNTLGCGATTLSIKRNRVGKYEIEDSVR